MTLLIVESNPELASVWQRHIARLGREVLVAHSQSEAIHMLQCHGVALLLLDIELEDGSAFAVADYAAFRFPKVPVLFVTSSRFFSDGSIFAMAPNACAFLASGTPPEDLAMMVEHYATRS
ncbi:MAG: response regulator [Rhodobacteraceae bacterium]|nr:response regulator [Paracoccaceae bacterium]